MKIHVPFLQSLDVPLPCLITQGPCHGPWTMLIHVGSVDSRQYWVKIHYISCYHIAGDAFTLIIHLYYLIFPYHIRNSLWSTYIPITFLTCCWFCRQNSSSQHFFLGWLVMMVLVLATEIKATVITDDHWWSPMVIHSSVEVHVVLLCFISWSFGLVFGHSQP